jgi:hypothetical protein
MPRIVVRRWSERNHPVWSVVKLVVVFAGVNSLLWLNASQFDSGEVKTALGTIAVAAIMEGFGIKRRADEPKAD